MELGETRNKEFVYYYVQVVVVAQIDGWDVRCAGATSDKVKLKAYAVCLLVWCAF